VAAASSDRAEGRKYGLFLVLATQRPAKLHRGFFRSARTCVYCAFSRRWTIGSAADNWGVSLEDVMRTRHFATGDGLLLGRWVPSTTAFMLPCADQEGGAV